MKKFFIIAALAIFAGGSFAAWSTNEGEEMTELQRANVDASVLSDPEPGPTPDPNVKCYCRKSGTVYLCSARGTGAYCGGDPCVNHDSNCR